MNQIICADVREQMKTLPNESIDCVITSPPYWALRDYGIEPTIWDGDENCEHEWGESKEKKTNLQAGNPEFQRPWREEASGISKAQFCTKCSAWKGQLGLEPTFDLYIRHLCDIFDEIKRVLKKTGTCWINIGDTYSGGGQGGADWNGKETTPGSAYARMKIKEVQPKSLCQIPSRFAIEMSNRGWILRNELIWYKPNCMPSSAKDRFTVDFEKIFFFTKSRRYFFEQQFEPSIGEPRWGGDTFTPKEGTEYKNEAAIKVRERLMTSSNRNKRCVWKITTNPFPEAHFAVFPEKLIEPMIKSGCPRNVCVRCGQPKEKVYETKINTDDLNFNERTKLLKINIGAGGEIFKRDYINDPEYRKRLAEKETIFKGYSTCSCNVGFKAGIVLDPFMGSGTTCVVARKQGRDYIGIDIKEEYVEMTKKRIGFVTSHLSKWFEWGAVK